MRTDAQDGRARVLALTPTGSDGLEDDDARGGSRLIRGLGDWTRADLDAFAGYLARLNAGSGPPAADADPIADAARTPATAS